MEEPMYAGGLLAIKVAFGLQQGARKKNDEYTFLQVIKKVPIYAAGALSLGVAYGSIHNQKS